jgi:hypothetical protein
MKLRVARKILRFSLRGFTGMTKSQRSRESRVHWNKRTIARAFARLGPYWVDGGQS